MNDFENNIVHQNNNISSNYYAIPGGVLENNTTYYWCAKAYDGIKWSDNWSEVFSFTLDITIQVPTIPKPIDNSIIIDTTPVLDWEDVYDATEYHIQVNTEENFEGTMIEEKNDITQSEYPITTPLENDKYYWKVRIKTKKDEIWGDWGNTWSFTIDNSSPTVAITSNESKITASSPFSITITFNEKVTEFAIEDITVDNGSASNFVDSENPVFTDGITPSEDPVDVTVDIAAGVCTDLAGNNNTAASPFSIRYDSVILSVAISSAESDPTNSSPFTVTITFSEAVTGFVVEDIQIV
ncbi:hypothetical protein ES703_34422 [subsurface metagenome]